jgi:hypothetical protein
MPFDAEQRELIRRFRERFEARHLPRFGQATRDDRADDSTLASRFAVGERLWLEMCVRPLIPQLRAGIVTDDRWRNEDLEDKIEESGDTMSEFVELGFEEAGLEWRNPPVEHYRDQGKYFCFATAFELKALSDLSQDAVLDKVSRMFEGYYEAFRPAIEKAVQRR